MVTYQPLEVDDPLLSFIQAGRIEEARAFLNVGNYDALDLSQLINATAINLHRLWDINTFIRNLGRSLEKTCVTTLDLSNNLFLINFLQNLQNTNITKLKLQNNRIGDVDRYEEVEVDAIATNLPRKIVELDLSNNHIRRSNFVSLLPRNLRVLNLSHNRIGTAGICLFDNLRLTQIDKLNVSYNHLMNVPYFSLVLSLESGPICSINVDNNGLPQNVLDDIRKATLENKRRRHRDKVVFPAIGDGAELGRNMEKINKKRRKNSQILLPDEIVALIGNFTYPTDIGMRFLQGFKNSKAIQKQLDQENKPETRAAKRKRLGI